MLPYLCTYVLKCQWIGYEYTNMVVHGLLATVYPKQISRSDRSTSIYGPVRDDKDKPSWPTTYMYVHHNLYILYVNRT